MKTTERVKYQIKLYDNMVEKLCCKYIYTGIILKIPINIINYCININTDILQSYVNNKELFEPKYEINKNKPNKICL